MARDDDRGRLKLSRALDGLAARTLEVMDELRRAVAELARSEGVSAGQPSAASEAQRARLALLEHQLRRLEARRNGPGGDPPS